METKNEISFRQIHNRVAGGGSPRLLTCGLSARVSQAGALLSAAMSVDARALFSRFWIALLRLLLRDSAIKISHFGNSPRRFLLCGVCRSALSAAPEAAGDPSVKSTLDYVPALLQPCK